MSEIRNNASNWPIWTIVCWRSQWPHERHYAVVTGFLKDAPRDSTIFPTECRVQARILYKTSIHEAGTIVEWPTWSGALEISDCGDPFSADAVRGVR